MIRYILSIISILFITLSSWAQGGLPSRYNVSYLNMAAGMPNNFADDIFQDSYGFVWISTHGGGLVRYDGFNFMNFGLGSVGISLRSNSCRNVCEDPFKRLWVAFEEGPQVLDLNTMQPVVPPCENSQVKAQLNKVFKNLCTRIYCDAKGNIWMLSVNQLTRFGFNEKGEVNSVLSTSYPYNAPDLGICFMQQWSGERVLSEEQSARGKEHLIPVPSARRSVWGGAYLLSWQDMDGYESRIV